MPALVPPVQRDQIWKGLLSPGSSFSMRGRKLLEMGEGGLIPIFPPNPGRLSTTQPPNFPGLTGHVSLSSRVGPPSALGSHR